jgi:hypothetical protein
MIRIRRFGVVRTATVAAILYGLGSIIFFTIFALIWLVIGSSLPDLPGSNISGGMLGAGGAIGILISGVIISAIYGVFGWVVTAILCLLYNWVAGFAGGIEMQLETSPTPPAPVAVAIPPAATPPAAPAPGVPPTAEPPASPTEPPAAPTP